LSYQVTYIVEGFTLNLPEALKLVAQTGEYAAETVIVDKDGEVVFTFMAYAAVVKV
jgi:hypothetical protein